MHRYGVTREQLGQLVVTQRSHAALNPTAVYRSPLDLDDYLSARMISSPLCLYDCDVPVDASTAVIVSRRDTVADLRRPVAIEAMAMSSHGRSSFGQWEDMTTMAFHDSATRMWSRTNLTTADVDTAQLYDGFSYLCLLWLEALGFCGPGESGLFVEKAERITFGGELPLNTWGGQLSAGRIHIGFGHCAEAIRQLRGEAGPRQVDGAEVSIFSMGIAHVANCMLLTSL
jgi:acetyl-CoA acetyltransferase